MNVCSRVRGESTMKNKPIVFLGNEHDVWNLPAGTVRKNTKTLDSWSLCVGYIFLGAAGSASCPSAIA